MSKPTIAQKKPYIVDLEAGDYWFCTCGLSTSQPFCDGKHAGTGFVPQKFTVEEKRKAGLCGCKHSTDKPFCDGTHNKL